MTRFDGDCDEDFPGQWWLWENALRRSVNGKKGQRNLRDLRDALLALPEKRLISGRLADENGCVCTVGALWLKRQVDAGVDRAQVLAAMAGDIEWNEEYGVLDPWDAETVTLDIATAAGLSRTMAVVLAGDNDGWTNDTPERRYERVLRYVEQLIVPELAA